VRLRNGKGAGECTEYRLGGVMNRTEDRGCLEVGSGDGVGVGKRRTRDGSVDVGMESPPGVCRSVGYEIGCGCGFGEGGRSC
jgi:hypothetical protein